MDTAVPDEKAEVRDEKAQDITEKGETIGSEWSHEGLELHPKPTSDPLDPLNWSSFKKHSILAIVMWM